MTPFRICFALISFHLQKELNVTSLVKFLWNMYIIPNMFSIICRTWFLYFNQGSGIENKLDKYGTSALLSYSLTMTTQDVQSYSIFGLVRYLETITTNLSDCYTREILLRIICIYIYTLFLYHFLSLTIFHLITHLFGYIIWSGCKHILKTHD